MTWHCFMDLKFYTFRRFWIFYNNNNNIYMFVLNSILLLCSSQYDKKNNEIIRLCVCVCLFGARVHHETVTNIYAENYCKIIDVKYKWVFLYEFHCFELMNPFNTENRKIKTTLFSHFVRFIYIWFSCIQFISNFYYFTLNSMSPWSPYLLIVINEMYKI